MRLIYRARIKKNGSLKSANYVNEKAKTNGPLINIDYSSARIELADYNIYNDGYGNKTETSRIQVNDVPACIVESKDLDVLQEIFRELHSIDPDKWVWYNLEERVNEELERKRKREEKEAEKAR